MVAAALALVAVVPVGALAAADGSAGGSTTGESAAAASPPAASSPAVTAPPSSGWTSQGASTEGSSGGDAPLRHGSSVGSDDIPSQPADPPKQPTSEVPSYTTASSGYVEPESSTPPASEEPVSTPQAASEVGSTEPPPTTEKADRAAVGAATAVALSKAPQGGGVSSAPPAAPAPFKDSGDQAASGSYALPLLAMAVLSLVLGFACVRLWRRRKRRRLEALWRQQDATWEAALRRVKPVGESSNGRMPVAH